MTGTGSGSGGGSHSVGRAIQKTEVLAFDPIAPGEYSEATIGIEAVPDGTAVHAVPTFDVGTDPIGWCCRLVGSDQIVVRIFNYGLEAGSPVGRFVGGWAVTIIQPAV